MINDMINEMKRSILIARDNRNIKKDKLIKKYNLPLILFTLNIQGLQKYNDKISDIFSIGINEINNCFDIKESLIEHLNTGCEGYFVIDSDALDIKRKCNYIEDNHVLGRAFDIDVFDIDGKVISRNSIGKPRRTCFICNGNVDVCRRNNNHTVDEYMNKLYFLLKVFQEKQDDKN